MAILAAFFEVWMCYVNGITEFIERNDIPPDLRVARESMGSELQEFLYACYHFQPWEMILEFNDFLHTIIKYILLRFASPKIFSNKILWSVIFFMALPSTIKLGLRYKNYKCIRNHRNSANINHKCSYGQ